MHEIEKRVRHALRMALGGTVDVGGLDRSDDLFAAGMTSHQTVQVMLRLEDEFDVEFADEELVKATFATIDSMVAALAVHS
ncbi:MULTISPECIES: phosphopantetheine-binding protein [Dietzia]|uniref:phosphopantetheine-binding protein n=1 Tax=Dietzia TaxID=37914 RepID=UPI001F07E40F|nr:MULTISPECIES: phosphopantetheine-binding protein [Dietzia]USX47383.1 phosphopantetheine-binding protein [Dietzia kunjamensis]